MQINGKEWYKSRRLWAVGISAICGILMVVAPDQYVTIKTIGMALASALGITSLALPDKV